jgi:hypothetical protein
MKMKMKMKKLLKKILKSINVYIPSSLVIYQDEEKFIYKFISDFIVSKLH